MSAAGNTGITAPVHADGAGLDMESADAPGRASPRSWGLRDEDFEQRRPLRGQITKREVRAVSLYCMGLRPDSIVWDIGAGTGSISVEAALFCHMGRIYAVERDEATLPLLRENVNRYGRDNVEIVAGSAPAVLTGLPDPDSVFIGGNGGGLAGILQEAAGRLRSGGRIVANFATLERTNETYQWFLERGFQSEISMVNAARSRAMPDGSVRLEALNPVFVVSAWREVTSGEGRENEQRND